MTMDKKWSLWLTWAFSLDELKKKVLQSFRHVCLFIIFLKDNVCNKKKKISVQGYQINKGFDTNFFHMSVCLADKA